MLRGIWELFCATNCNGGRFCAHSAPSWAGNSGCRMASAGIRTLCPVLTSVASKSGSKSMQSGHPSRFLFPNAHLNYYSISSSLAPVSRNFLRRRGNGSFVIFTSLFSLLWDIFRSRWFHCLSPSICCCNGSECLQGWVGACLEHS